MMKIATFLLTDNEVTPFANNAKSIELTEAYVSACAANNMADEADAGDIDAMLEVLKNNALQKKQKLCLHMRVN